MMGTKQRFFAPPVQVSLEELVPHDYFYRHLARILDLSFVRAFVQETYAGIGRLSIDPVVFFKLQLGRFFRLTAQFFQTVTRRTLALLDESQNSSHNSESQKVKRLTGNLRHMEEMRTIGGVRVCKQEHHESPQIDALKKQTLRNGLQ
jgi:hypothetical protein